MPEVLYGTKTECDLTKTENSRFHNEEQELAYVCRGLICVPSLL